MYGIRIPLATDDYVWLTEHNKRNLHNSTPLLFRTRELAVKYASDFDNNLVKVEKYGDES